MCHTHRGRASERSPSNETSIDVLAKSRAYSSDHRRRASSVGSNRSRKSSLKSVPEERVNDTKSGDDENVHINASHQQDLAEIYDELEKKESILRRWLTRYGPEKFDPSVEGEKLNPNEHEATFMTPMQESKNTRKFPWPSMVRSASVGSNTPGESLFQGLCKNTSCK